MLPRKPFKDRDNDKDKVLQLTERDVSMWSWNFKSNVYMLDMLKWNLYMLDMLYIVYQILIMIYTPT